MKKFIILLFSLSFIFVSSMGTFADSSETTAENADALWDYLDVLRFGDTAVLSDKVAPEFNFDLRSVCLTEAETGTVLYEENKDERYMPASVTKVMTLLLLFEAIDSGKITLEDTVTASEHAASMGGSQIYLKVGEEMSVAELLKAVAVPSANDAAVALAEHLCGSETEFVRIMNKRATELGMKNTNFTNCTGLFDDENHYTSAYDIAIMSRELIKHTSIFDFSMIWMDSLRNGEFILSNTNKMLRSYNGMKGLKTGYTKASLYCFSGVAERNGMTLIVTVMGAPKSEDRFSAAATLLNFGFSNFAVAKPQNVEIADITVEKGKKNSVKLSAISDYSLVVPKGWEDRLAYTVSLPEKLTAPLSVGDEVGVITYKLKDETVKTYPITIAENIEKASLFDYFKTMLKLLIA